MLLELASQMHWPFAMVCIAAFGGVTVAYVTRKSLKLHETKNELKALESENYRLKRLSED